MVKIHPPPKPQGELYPKTKSPKQIARYRVATHKYQDIPEFPDIRISYRSEFVGHMFDHLLPGETHHILKGRK